MFCPFCGFENDNQNLFCIHCGTQLPKVSPIPQPRVSTNISGTSDSEEELVEDYRDAFVKKNTAYYSEKMELLEHHAAAVTWNWSAFIFGTLWLAYRRVYSYAWLSIGFDLVACIVFSISVGFVQNSHAITQLIYLILSPVLAYSVLNTSASAVGAPAGFSTPEVLLIVLLLLKESFFGAFGNQLYSSFVTNKISTLHTQKDGLAAISKRGGTSGADVFGILVLEVAIGAAIGALLTR